MSVCHAVFAVALHPPHTIKSGISNNIKQSIWIIVIIISTSNSSLKFIDQQQST